MDHTIRHIGPITKTVAENAQMLEVIAGPDWRDPQWIRVAPEPDDYLGAATVGVSGLRVGVISEALEPSGCSPDVLAAFEASLSTLSGLGAHIEPVSVPLWIDGHPIALAVLGFGLYGLATSHGIGFGHLGRVDPALTAACAAQSLTQADDLPAALKSYLVVAEHLLEHYQGVPLARAPNLRLELLRQLARVLTDFDVLVTPTTAQVAFELLDRRAELGEMAAGLASAKTGVNTVQLDLSGHPALTVPGGTGKHGLAVGLQIIGLHFGEDAVTRWASPSSLRLGDW
jgi:amidase